METTKPNYYLKQLSIEDMPFIKDLLDCHADNSQHTAPIAHRLQNDTELTTLRLYGLFLDSTLIVIGGGFFGLKMPFWTLAYFHHRKGFSSTDSQVLDTLIEHAEGQGIYRFDYIYDPQSFTSLLIKLSEKANRYQYYDDALIKKQTHPQFDYHWLHLAQQVQDADTIVRAAVLKEEFRKAIINKMKKNENNKSSIINLSCSSEVN